MKTECIESLIACNREIIFSYKKRKYSITYYNDGREKYISFCEFYKEPIDCRDSNEVLAITINGITLEKIFSKLPDSAFDIY